MIQLIAKACGYNLVFKADTKDEIIEKINMMKQ